MATFYKTIKKHIFLHPVDKKRRHAAIKSTLLQDKKKYSDRLEGALLDVGNLKVVGDRHLIVDGYLSMEVVADFHVFSPKPGEELEGVINKRSKSHLGCLVMDTFNAALAIPSSSDLDPQVGDTCRFTVTEVVVDGEILFMRGTVINVEPGSRSIDGLPEFTPQSVAGAKEKDNDKIDNSGIAEDEDTSNINKDEGMKYNSKKSPHKQNQGKNRDRGLKRISSDVDRDDESVENPSPSTPSSGKRKRIKKS